MKPIRSETLKHLDKETLNKIWFYLSKELENLENSTADRAAKQQLQFEIADWIIYGGPDNKIPAQTSEWDRPTAYDLDIREMKTIFNEMLVHEEVRDRWIREILVKTRHLPTPQDRAEAWRELHNLAQSALRYSSTHFATICNRLMNIAAEKQLEYGLNKVGKETE